LEVFTESLAKETFDERRRQPGEVGSFERLASGKAELAAYPGIVLFDARRIPGELGTSAGRIR
jgi:hypothetical protein